MSVGPAGGSTGRDSRLAVVGGRTGMHIPMPGLTPKVGGVFGRTLRSVSDPAPRFRSRPVGALRGRITRIDSGKSKANTGVSASRAHTLGVTVKKVGAAVGPIFHSTHSRGASLSVNSSEDDAHRMRDLFIEVKKVLIAKKVIPPETTDLRVFYDRSVIQYTDPSGATVEKSILAEMEGDPDLKAKVEDLARFGHQVRGTTYSPTSLQSGVKGSLNAGAALRRASNDREYLDCQSRIDETKTKIQSITQSISRMPRMMSRKQISKRWKLGSDLSKAQAELQRLEKELEGFSPIQKIPRTIDKSKAIAHVPPAKQPEFDARTDAAKTKLEALRTAVDECIEIRNAALETAKNPLTTPAVSKDKIAEIEQQLAALRAFKVRISEVDEFALTMALAHAPEVGASEDALNSAAENLRHSVDAHCLAEYRKEQQKRAERTWIQFGKDMVGQYDTLPPMDHYNAEYAKDVGGLIYAISDDPSKLYHQYCLDNNATVKAPHMTDVILAQVLRKEKDPAADVSDLVKRYLDGMHADDADAILAAMS